jgi:nucleotide-binding universal stress UspA family protein
MLLCSPERWGKRWGTIVAYKSILVPFDDSSASRAALDTAYMIASQHDSHLEVFHVRADSKESIPLLGEGFSGAMIEEMIEAADQESGERSTRAERYFEEFRKANDIALVQSGPGPGGVTVWWREEIGREDQLVALRGRRTDLVVVGRPAEAMDQSAFMTLHAAIFETARPVLLAPSEKPATIGRNIAIAWNGSMQAARAVSSALPLLAGADNVYLAAFDTERSEMRFRGHELSEHLSWHGIETKSVETIDKGQDVGAGLLQMCAANHIDLLVMGAYTHSRLMQIVFGGVTRHVIDNAKVPVLMSH